VTQAHHRAALVALGVAFGGLVLVVGANSTAWIGRTFPGFLLMANRVVPSIALPDWEAAHTERLFQHQVIAVDGAPVASAAEVYARVAARPPGTVHDYLLRAPDGTTSTVSAAARRFSGVEYGLLFGAYLSTGLAFFLTGIVVFWLKRSAASAALFVQSLTTGLFVVTAADLYGPHWFFRVHVVAEAMLAAGFVHLAMVFPTDRLGPRRRTVLAVVYGPFALLAGAYQLALASPSAYTAVHLAASASHGLGALAIIGIVAWDLSTTASPLVRRRIAVVALGTFGAFALPGALMAASAVFGGSVPINAGAFTAFVFPLSLGYAIVKQDLFEIDVMVRRAATYAVALVAITATYLAALAGIGALVPLRSLSPATMALLNFGILLAMAPIKARAQAAVERIFYRRRYDPERVLSALSQALSSARSLAQVEAHTLHVLAETVHPASATLWLTDEGVAFRCVAPAERVGALVTVPATTSARLARGAIVSDYALADRPGGEIPAFWQVLDAEIVVPIRSGASVIGVLGLGQKQSGRSYDEHDSVFLAAAASQVGLALTNARAFDRLAQLNASLEDQVRERTAALEIANRDLGASYGAVQSTLRQLEQSQASLMRADRLATLGRLAASIAHEVNTPLGAVLNALQTLGTLGREYQDSIADATVTPDDHREIAREIVASADAAAGWARKAAAFITRVKHHGREPHPAWRQSFAVRAVVDETRILLGQRLRLESCALVYEETTPDVTLVGDPARLGQVLVNLVSNALDAYEEKRVAESRIAITARTDGDVVELRVRDWAGGMPAEVAARIFDELFTTKDPGRGTGLGLSISRNLVEQSFGGTLGVDTDLGVGSCFVLTLPIDAPAEARRGVDAA
jgi:signal transduction histidine kinase